MASGLLHISDVLSLIYHQRVETSESIGLKKAILIISGLDSGNIVPLRVREICLQRIRVKYALLFDNSKIDSALEELDELLEKDNSGQSAICITTTWLKRQRYIIDLYGENLEIV